MELAGGSARAELTPPPAPDPWEMDRISLTLPRARARWGSETGVPGLRDSTVSPPALPGRKLSIYQRRQAVPGVTSGDQSPPQASRKNKEKKFEGERSQLTVGKRDEISHRRTA